MITETEIFNHFTAMENQLVYRLWPTAGHAHCSNSYHAAVAQSLLYVAQT